MNAADPTARLIRAVGDRYDIEGELGRGGMAVVYAATDRRLKRRVAIKVLPPELAFRSDVRERFLREAQLAAHLAHPHIVPVYAVEEHEGLVYIVMGRVEGETLAERLAREPRPPLHWVRRVLRETADALAHAHARGVVHRDIKPDNILLESDGDRVQVTDFGIARAAEGDRLTATGVAVGTPAYMSPEQARGDDDVDGRADGYALGVVAYQLLAGTPPFNAANTPALLLKHVSEPPPPLRAQRPDLPPALVYAVERALAKDRESRWPDLGAFRDALTDEATVPPVGGVGRASVGASSSAAREPRPPVAAPSPSAPSGPPASGSVPGLPPYPVWRGGGEGDREEWRRAQQAWRERVRAQQDAWMAEVAERQRRRAQERAAGDGSLADRLRTFQRQALIKALIGSVMFLFNAATGGAPWFLFVWFGLAVSLGVQGMRLWQDGLRLRDFVRSPARLVATVGPGAALSPRAGGAALAPADAIAARALALAGDEALAGAHGSLLRRAVEDERAILDTLASLSTPDKAQLPDVQGTVQGLVERVGTLARSLDRLDRDLTPGQIGQLDARLSAARALPEGSDRDRKVQLLERQLVSLNDLADRRGTLLEQLEHAALVLQTMRLDLLRLRSAGIGAASEMQTVTQEARALSADIERVVGAAREVRAL